jgi:two-component system sensor histidine kinase VanS
MSARLRLTLSYAGFLVAAGAAVLLGVYVVLRFVPNVPVSDERFIGAPGIAPRGDVVRAVLLMSAGVLSALAVIGLVGGWLLAGWVLRPLEEISAATRIAATGRLDHRIRMTGRADEFGRLADDIDHMLERLHDAFLVQERFAANASHELRTPLAVTATMLEVARLEEDARVDPGLLERLETMNARAIAIVEALLRLADVNAVTATSAPVDLASVAADAVADARAEADRRGIELHVELSRAVVDGDHDLLTSLAANLVQNAVRHGDPDGDAWIETSSGPGAPDCVLRVRNTGPSFTRPAAAHLAEPFLRGGGRVAERTGERGYGLGLALVARIAAVHGGSLSVEPREGGGLDVAVSVPRGAREPQPVG